MRFGSRWRRPVIIDAFEVAVGGRHHHSESVEEGEPGEPSAVDRVLLSGAKSFVSDAPSSYREKKDVIPERRVTLYLYIRVETAAPPRPQ